MEQNLGVFLVSAILISLSGVLSPGPMTAAVVERGGRSGLSGIYISLGHGVVEFPIIAVLAYGAESFFQAEFVKVVVGLAGGVYLLCLGHGMLKPSADDSKNIEERQGSSVLAGIFLSIGNPYFLVWWATVGLGLVISATHFGIIGVVLFAIVHWLCDLVWLGFLSAASNKVVRRFGPAFYSKVSLVSGSVLLFFGAVFIWGAVKLLVGV